MGWPVLTIGHVTSVFLTGGGGQPIRTIPGMPDPADHGMQGVRGSSPLSSTPGQRPTQRLTEPGSSPPRSRFAATLAVPALTNRVRGRAEPCVGRGMSPLDAWIMLFVDFTGYGRSYYRLR